MSSSTTGRRGPRPGEDTRALILDAARAEFSTLGYEATSVRAIARRAGVDPGLVRHYFGGKSSLCAASLELPVDPAKVLARVAESGPEGVGERVVRAFCQVWDEPAHAERLVALMRTTLAGSQFADLAKGFLVGPVFGTLARRTGASDPAWAAAQVVSQMMGLAILRYLLRLEPLASASPDELVNHYAPTIQRYLTS